MPFKRSLLHPIDLIILTLILFAQPIYSSTISWLSSVQSSQTDTLNNSENIYISMIIRQGLLLILVLIYLRLRNFNMKQWTFRISWHTTLKAVGIFLILAGLTDVFLSLFSPGYLTDLLTTNWNIASGFSALLAQFTNLPMVAYSLLNGCYKEIFFIGMCTAVKDSYKAWVFVASLVVRFAFHTYQGVIVALAISLILGLFYYF